jgi:hypothetical protein
MAGAKERRSGQTDFTCSPTAARVGQVSAVDDSEPETACCIPQLAVLQRSSDKIRIIRDSRYPEKPRPATAGTAMIPFPERF